MSILLYGCTTWKLTKRIEKKAWRKLHQNATSYLEKILEATFQKTAAVCPPTSHLQNHQIRQTKLFSSKTSVFHKICLKLTKRDSDDYLWFASVVNKNCDDFKLGELSAGNIKCLIFAQSLVSAKDSEIRRRVLSKLENEPDLTLQKTGWRLAEDSECQKRLKKYRGVWCCLRKESQA